MAEPVLSNIPMRLRMSHLHSHEPSTSNLPNDESVNWKNNNYLECAGKTEAEMGPKPGNCMAAVAWIEKFYEKLGEGLDQCSNIPVPDNILNPPVGEHQPQYTAIGTGQMIMNHSGTIQE